MICLLVLHAVSVTAKPLGTPGQDSKIRELRAQFRDASPVSESNLNFDKTWNCTAYSAKKNEYSVFSVNMIFSKVNAGSSVFDLYLDNGWFAPEYAFIDQDDNGVASIKTQTVQRGSFTYRQYFRSLSKTQLIGEFVVDADKSDTYSSLSVPAADVIQYITCKLKPQIEI
ncbi:MAG: hypothetical protein ACOYL6_06235 [Bacteriovoracaceae bacterium]